MYRLLLYYLIFLLLCALGLSAVGIIHYQPFDILLGSLYLTAVCWAANKVFAYVFNAPTNVESPLITALILALIISPTHTTNGLVFLTAAAGLATASKYILAINKRHLFNPAAIAVVLTSFAAGDAASWWVGTASMLPFVLAGGVLLVRRIRRSKMVLWFIATVVIVTAMLASVSGADVMVTTQNELLHSALFFMAFVMLTEPLTSPSTKQKQIWYAILVGALVPPEVHIATIYSTPELALVVGNVFSYALGPRVKTYMRLKQRTKLSRDSIDFAFTPEHPFAYKAGQYMEFTFQHPKTDSRGARRYFTLASSPTEPEVHLGLKFYQLGSSYKRELLKIDEKMPLVAGQIGGDFTLPDDPNQKIVFIAGGIGITPYRSMIKYLLDTKEKRQITLLYAARTPEDIVYRDVFEQAERELGIHAYYVVDNGGGNAPFYTGHIDKAFIQKVVPDLESSLFYVSGPHGMVVGIEETLRRLKVPSGHIKKDFFSGYA